MLTLPDAAAERIDHLGPQHPIEMAVHPEQVISLPPAVGASTTDTSEGSTELELGGDDQHPFGQL